MTLVVRWVPTFAQVCAMYRVFLRWPSKVPSFYDVSGPILNPLHLKIP